MVTYPGLRHCSAFANVVTTVLSNGGAACHLIHLLLVRSCFMAASGLMVIMPLCFFMRYEASASSDMLQFSPSLGISSRSYTSTIGLPICGLLNDPSEGTLNLDAQDPGAVNVASSCCGIMLIAASNGRSLRRSCSSAQAQYLVQSLNH